VEQVFPEAQIWSSGILQSVGEDRRTQSVYNERALRASNSLGDSGDEELTEIEGFLKKMFWRVAGLSTTSPVSPSTEFSGVEQGGCSSFCLIFTILFSESAS